MGKAVKASSAKPHASKVPASKAIKKSGKGVQPDALTLDEVRDRLLQQKFDDIGNAAQWLNTELWRGKVRLLADGVPVQAAGFIDVVPHYAPGGHVSLQIWLRRAINIFPKAWTIDRQSFEARLRATTKENRGGHPRLYPYEEALIEALVYVGTQGTPDNLEGDGGLVEKVELALQERNKRIPGKTSLANLFRDPFNRIDAARKARPRR
jgi:hypothetical protein